MIKEVSFLRQLGWISPEDFTQPINIIGCGAVGSTIALVLAKMGAKTINIWDDDLVESHNLPNQQYWPAQIGMHKADALKEELLRFNPNIGVTATKERISEQGILNLKGIVVLAVDSMSARKNITEKIFMNFSVPYVYEARLGFDHGAVHAINNKSMYHYNRWTKTLFNDDDVAEGPCNLRICPTLVNIVSNTLVQYICEYFVSISKNSKYNTPFQTLFCINEKEGLIVKTIKVEG